MSERIRHFGIVEQINETSVLVRLHQMSACTSCQISEHCHTFESKEKIIEVMGEYGQRLGVGEQVVVYTSKKMAHIAVWYAYAFPFILMLGMLVLVLYITHQEIWAALASLSVLVVYYTILYLCHDKWKPRIIFEIE